MPLFRRVAKRGFNNAYFSPSVAIINVGELCDSFEANAEVTPEILASKGLIRTRFDEVKILGDGTVTKALKVSAHRFSSSAEQKIAAAGGVLTRIAAGV